MPFVISPERFGIEKGMLRLIKQSLQTRFGAAGVKLMPDIDALEDADKYAAAHEAILTTSTLDEVRRKCTDLAAPPEPAKKRARRKPKPDDV